jgi:hypothetical protein
MTDERPDPSLNPALRERREETYDTTHPTPPPADSASVQRDESGPWPVIWLVVTIVCVAIAVYLVFF